MASVARTAWIGGDMTLRQEVISLYKELIRLSRTWKPVDASETQAQREYIKRETRYWFRKNRDLFDETKIRCLLEDAWRRIEVAKHYGIAYERPAYYPTGMIRKLKKKPNDPSTS